jgi:hypothetical protein
MTGRFGPMTKEIERSASLGDQITDEDMQKIMDAYVLRGADDGKYAWRAAREAGRETEVAAGAGAMSKEIEVNGFDRPRGLIVITSRAAFDAGVALGTKDLLGVAFYGQSDYDRLLFPWRAAFPETGR